MEENRVTNFRVVIIGGSAGSLEVLMQVIPQLQKGLPVAIVIVLHRKSGDDTTLEDLFAAKSQLPVYAIEDKILLEPGNIYIAPADYHLLFEKSGRMSLDVSEKINYSRPSIDVAFESAAEVYGSNLTALLLSGANADGTAGMQAIHANGGVVAVQDPASADMSYMPKSALDSLEVDYVLEIAQIGVFIGEGS